MYSYVRSGTIVGMDCHIVTIETDASPGLPSFEMVGMLNSEVREAKERVKVSLKNNGYSIPPLKITLNLSPANIRKSGTKFDLPIAISILIALGEIKQESIDNIMFLGELGLDGELGFVQGVLPLAIEARNLGITKLIVPTCNSKEASVVEGVDVYGADCLIDVIRIIDDIDNQMGNFAPVKTNVNELFKSNIICDSDYSEVSGQYELKRAAMIATAGFHNLLMIGTPGSGKSLVAKRLPTILPMLHYEESIEVSKIYSIAGKLTEDESLVTKRPFISAHHTSSVQSLVGGGTNPQPGLISLAHRGVLFLDEAVHFNTQALEALRQPIEDKYVNISRSLGNYRFPADFMLVAAINPCPCGYYPDRNKCRCTEKQIANYINKLSGPILDRIDICAASNQVEYEDLHNVKSDISSQWMRDRIEIAIDRQKYRYRNMEIEFNSELKVKDISEFCKLDNKDEIFLEKAYKNLNISARGYHKILKTARTIADLDDKDKIAKKHLAEAINYRTIRNNYW